MNPVTAMIQFVLVIFIAGGITALIVLLSYAMTQKGGDE